MFRFVILSLALVALINSLNISKTAAAPPTTNQNYTTYVKTACNSTTYSTICYNSLSPYSSTIKANPIKLCETSLNVNLKSAKNATLFVSNLLKKAKSTSKDEVPVLESCMDEMTNAIDELEQSIAEIKNLNGGGVSNEKHLNNMKTWVTAALTDATTCSDNFEEGEVNEQTKKTVNDVVSVFSKITTTSLDLISKYLH